MSEKRTSDYDIGEIIAKLWKHRKAYYKALPIAFVLSCAYVLCLPRYYSTSIQLVPELGTISGKSGLADLASSFGLDLGDNPSMDAISPMLYPDLMKDNKFVAGLFDVRVCTGLNDGEQPIDTTYYAYLARFQKYPFWAKAIAWVKRQFKSKPAAGSGKPQLLDPYRLSEEQTIVAEAIRGCITMITNKKTGVITITTKAQDPLVAKMIADTVRVRLQDYIIDYRTNKARIDMNYYRDMADKAKASYDSARHAYGVFTDKHYMPSLTSVIADQEDLVRDMELKYNTYTSLEAQYQSALVKLQSQTPAFTMLKGAEVPYKPAGPKRMLTVALLTFLACCAVSLRIMLKYNKEV